MSCEDDMVLVRRELQVDSTPEELWEAVTELDWLAADVDLDVRPGGRGWFRDHDGTVRHAEVDEVDDGHRLTLRWWTVGGADDGVESEVTLTVAPVGGGARLIVVERPLAPVAQASASGWHARLGRLALVGAHA